MSDEMVEPWAEQQLNVRSESPSESERMAQELAVTYVSFEKM